jgi:hypothetical protein
MSRQKDKYGIHYIQLKGLMGVARRNGQLSQGLSPREWGCTGTIAEADWQRVVVPTRVGVYRMLVLLPRLRWRCPHASGGVPNSRTKSSIATVLSPREWGCTESFIAAIDEMEVVPTRVGVYRIASIMLHCPRGCPHASGGVPESYSSSSATVNVVPTRVGVYRFCT